MRLNHLQLTNFRLHTDTRIDFETGLTGIIGPNGSGKTTILEAIAWALYGMPAARGKRQDIRSLNAPGRAGVRVELDFDLSGHRHRVVRTLSTAELYLDSGTAPIANSTSSVTDVLRRRLGMSQQEFFHTYFTGQKELGVMAAMGPAERAQFLSRVLGYEKLRAAQTLVRERRSVVRGELSGLQTAMPDSESVARALAEAEERLKDAESRAKIALARLKKADKTSADLAPRWKAAQEEREALQQIVAELRVREEEETALARDAERLTRELAEIVGAREEIVALSAELNIHADLAAQLVEMERLLQDEGRRKELQRTRQALETEIARLIERVSKIESPIEALVETEDLRERLREEVEAVAREEEAARNEWVRDLQEAKTKREALLSQHAETKEQRNRLVELGPDSPCPICTRPLTDHFREVLDELDGRLTEIEVNGKYFRNRVEQLEETPPTLRDIEARALELAHRLEVQTTAVGDAQLRAQEYVQLKNDIGDRHTRLATVIAELEGIQGGYHETRHALLRQQHAQLAPVAERKAGLAALADREPKVRKDAERVQKDLARARKQVAELRGRQRASRFSEDAFAKLKAGSEAATAELRAAELGALGAEKELEAARVARAAADATRKELERAQERLRSLTMERRLHDELDLAYTDIRSELNQHLRPELSELASGFLAELTEGRYTDLELDDDYNIIVKEDDIPKPVISGGEEDLAHLVLRLAISQMIAERAGQSFSLLVLDEVFGSLDEARRHNVVELLRRLHDRFEQVVLITHIESVRDGLDRVLTVRYDEQARVSRVAQESASLSDDTRPSGEYAAAEAGGRG